MANDDNNTPQEGDIATNPTTGDRVQLRNNKWEPIPSIGPEGAKAFRYFQANPPTRESVAAFPQRISSEDVLNAQLNPTRPGFRRRFSENLGNIGASLSIPSAIAQWRSNPSATLRNDLETLPRVLRGISSLAVMAGGYTPPVKDAQGHWVFPDLQAPSFMQDIRNRNWRGVAGAVAGQAANVGLGGISQLPSAAEAEASMSKTGTGMQDTLRGIYNDATPEQQKALQANPLFKDIIDPSTSGTEANNALARGEPTLRARMMGTLKNILGDEYSSVEKDLNSWRNRVRFYDSPWTRRGWSGRNFATATIGGVGGYLLGLGWMLPSAITGYGWPSLAKRISGYLADTHPYSEVGADVLARELETSGKAVPPSSADASPPWTGKVNWISPPPGPVVKPRFSIPGVAERSETTPPSTPAAETPTPTGEAPSTETTPPGKPKIRITRFKQGQATGRVTPPEQELLDAALDHFTSEADKVENGSKPSSNLSPAEHQQVANELVDLLRRIKGQQRGARLNLSDLTDSLKQDPQNALKHIRDYNGMLDDADAARVKDDLEALLGEVRAKSNTKLSEQAVETLLKKQKVQ